jgi:hypothetical protein
MSLNLVAVLIFSFIYLIYLLYINNSIILNIKKKLQFINELEETDINIVRTIYFLEIKKIKDFINKEKKSNFYIIPFLSIVVGLFYVFFPFPFFIIETSFIFIYIFSTYTLLKHLNLGLIFLLKSKV